MKRTKKPYCRRNAARHILPRWLAPIMIVMLCLSFCCADAEMSDGTAPDPFVPDDASFGGSLAEFETEGLTKSHFDADDLPEHYKTPSENLGRVIKIIYSTSNNISAADLMGKFSAPFYQASGDDTAIKHVNVYLPAGYDDTDACYNILYLLHGSSGSPERYLNPDQPTYLQNILDHMIEDGLIEPMIIVAATYYPEDEMTKILPLAMKAQLARSFPDELVHDIIPRVESQVRTHAASTSMEDIAASRDHRGIAGFSLGGVATWYVFQQQMRAFRWFLPISEAGWDDGEGGVTGILDRNVSARAIYNSVKAQGFGPEDFMLFVATGSDDEAFDVTTNQMIALLEYDDLFIVGTNTSCSMMNNGRHTISALYTYAYHILPSLFVEPSEQPIFDPASDQADR